jgi:signal transduction histidine kinase
MKSLKRQLIVWIVGLVAGVGILASGVSYYFALQDANTFLDHQLQEVAVSVDEGSQLPAMQASFVRENKEEQERDFVIQVWVENNPVVSSRPDFNLPRQKTSGFSDAVWGHSQWRIYTMVHPHRTVQISQDEDVRSDIAAQSAMWVLLPVLILIPLSWLLVAYAVSRLLKPLETTTRAAINRDIHSNEPLPVENVPTEVTPLIKAMNDLIVRLGKALELQRQFLSDAAHGLRTPLAALQLQIENLSRNRSCEDLDNRIDDMRHGSQRASHMVGQLLKIARYDAQNNPVRSGEVHLDEIVKECLAELISFADQRNVDLGMINNDPVNIWSSYEDVRTLIGNLIDNAIRYTPEGGKVDISLGATEHNAVVEIMDTGPGISENVLPHVFDRFFRVAGQETEGTGIGLAIVKAIAERESIDVILANRKDSNGLSARVVFDLTR